MNRCMSFLRALGGMVDVDEDEGVDDDEGISRMMSRTREADVSHAMDRRASIGWESILSSAR